MGNNFACCQYQEENFIDEKGNLTQLDIVVQPKPRKQAVHQAMFNTSFRDHQVTMDPMLAFVLNDTEVLGRKGFAKIEIVEKL
jgi:hypothetical protein